MQRRQDDLRLDPERLSNAFSVVASPRARIVCQGTGLGPSMIHGFVRQSGGQVRITTELGKGTRICLYVPRFEGSMDATTVHEAAGLAEAGQGETVLVIDDETTVRMLMADALQDAGYAVLQAEDGPSALKVLHSIGRIDLLITDVGLPGGMNGRQVAEAARVLHLYVPTT